MALTCSALRSSRSSSADSRETRAASSREKAITQPPTCTTSISSMNQPWEQKQLCTPFPYSHSSSPTVLCKPPRSTHSALHTILLYLDSQCSAGQGWVGAAGWWRPMPSSVSCLGDRWTWLFPQPVRLAWTPVSTTFNTSIFFAVHVPYLHFGFCVHYFLRVPFFFCVTTPRRHRPASIL